MCPATKPPTLSLAELPAVAVVSEWADFTRTDSRTIRKDLEAGRVPGAFRVGRSWRINTAVALASLAVMEHAEGGGE